MCMAPQIPKVDPIKPPPEPEPSAERVEPATNTASRAETARRGKRALRNPLDTSTTTQRKGKTGLNVPFA